MSVYKEFWMFWREYNQQKKQLYADACDEGIPVKREDRWWNVAKQIHHFYADEGTRKVETYLTGKTASFDCEIADEGTRRWHKFRVEYVISDGFKRLGCDGVLQIYQIS